MEFTKITTRPNASLLLFSLVTLSAAAQVEEPIFMQKRMLQDDPTFVVADSKIEKGGHRTIHGNRANKKIRASFHKIHRHSS